MDVDFAGLEEELAEETCWDNLRTRRVGRLAVSVSNRPDVFPVNYVVDGKAIVVQTAPGSPEPVIPMALSKSQSAKILAAYS